MILKGISVNQDPPTKDYLWITPKGNTRFWNQSTWMSIGGSGGSLPVIESSGKYLVTTGTQGNFSLAWSDIDLSNYISGTVGYAAIFNSSNSITNAVDRIRVGDGVIEWDSTNGGFKIYNANSTLGNQVAAGIYAGWVSALGANSSGGGGGGGGDLDWSALIYWDEEPEHIINKNYLPYNLEYVTSHPYYAVEEDSNGKLYVNINWHDTTYSAGTGLTLSGFTFNHSNSISQGNFGLSNNTTANNVTLPYVSYDGQGHISAVSSNTFTIGNLDAATVFSFNTKIPFSNLPNLYVGYTKISNSTNGNTQLKGISKITHATTNNDTSTAAIEWDQTNNAWHFYGGIYSDSFVSALGLNGSGGGGSGDINYADLWQELTSSSSEHYAGSTIINSTHLPLGYTQNNQNYPVQANNNKLYVNVPWTDTTYKLLLNGTQYGSGSTSLGSFFAPTQVGSNGYILKSNGSGAPSWIAQSSLSVGSATTATKLGTSNVGNAITPFYLNSGVATVCSIYRYHYDSTSDWSSYAWHKVAYVEGVPDLDACITFLVNVGSSSTQNGILRCRARWDSDGASTPSPVYNTAQITWVINNGIPIENFVLVWKSPYVELWCKTPARYSGYRFTLLDSGSRSANNSLTWILSANSGGHGSASYTSGGTVITSSVATLNNNLIGTVNGHTISADVNYGTANRLTYYNSSSQIDDTSIVSDGNCIKIGSSSSDYLQIGDAKIFWDSDNGGLKIEHVINGQTAGLYADWISALGANNGGGSGGGGINWADFWNELNYTETHEYSGTKIIDRRYLPINGLAANSGGQTLYAPTSAGSSGQYLRWPSSGSIPYWDTLDASDIPNLSASKINSGTFDAARIPTLSITDKTSGTLPINRGGTGRTTTASGAWYNTAASQTSPTIGTLPIAQGGTGQTSQANINKAFIGALGNGTSDVTDGTEFVSSIATDNGFSDSSAVNVAYRRSFLKVWNYIKGKMSSDSAVNISGNAATATILQTTRTINGTNFNGSANITTSTWGTARNISISDADSTNTGDAVSVNGSENKTLKLPSTIKASLSGNADTSTSAAKLSQTTITALSTFTDSNAFIYASAGGSNTVTDKPTSVDAFGVLSFKAAGGWYSQLLVSSNSASGMYWRVGQTLSGNWKKILDSNNYSSYALPRYNSNLTSSYIPKLSTTGQTDLANSIIFENSDCIGIGTTSPANKLHVSSKTNTWAFHVYNENASATTPFSSFFIANGNTGSGMWLGTSVNSSSYYVANFRYGATGDGAGGTSALYVRADGNIGVGTESPNCKLHAKVSSTNSCEIRTENDNGAVSLYTSTNRGIYDRTTSTWLIATNGTDSWLSRGNVGIGTTTPPVKLSVSGDIYASGGVTALQTVSSDKRLKKNIKKFNAKDIIDKLNPVSFEWNNKAKKLSDFKDGINYGLIAQDSDGIIDNLVFDLPDGNGYKGVMYEKLIPILLQAVKEQQKEIDELKQIIKKLKV